eukprot:TRINITY_DN50091_c0_g1_i1.p1 TRINITY_DN50091_c0_g1~~TRINITY_DN50091_c0_g1_i1.p1  ORF type:complete len:563 (-),score=96.93 TRINITY_DN50091_c0_g1_i1:128-1816(-)
MADDSPENKILAVFRKFDYNGDGLISRDELSNTFRALSPSMFSDSEKVDRMLKEMDTNVDGSVDMQEFTRWLMEPQYDKLWQLLYDDMMSGSGDGGKEAGDMLKSALRERCTEDVVLNLEVTVGTSGVTTTAEAGKVFLDEAAIAAKSEAAAAVRKEAAEKARRCLVSAGKKFGLWLSPGSGSTSGSPPAGVEPARRRLSVGRADDAEGILKHDMSAIAAEFSQLREEDIFKMLDSVSGGCKHSLLSVRDLGKTSFANKQMQICSSEGEQFDPAAQQVGFTCRKGLKPDSPNQDSWSMVRVAGNFSIYGVYDGHGRHGHDVADLVQESLTRLLIKDSRLKSDFPSRTDMLKEGFAKVQQFLTALDGQTGVDCNLSGTSCSLVIHDHQLRKLTVAHVADCKVVLLSYTDESRKTLRATNLTRNHTPDLKDERDRILKAGGRVVFDGYVSHRVYAKHGRYPGLNMSRSLGDLLGHSDAGVICEPEVLERQVDPLDHCLLLCSDGVWEFMTNDEAMRIISTCQPSEFCLAAEKLAKASWDHWIREESGDVVDDITAVLVHLQHEA